MEIETIWILVFVAFVTIVFIIGVYYTKNQMKSLKEPKQRKEHDDQQGTKINQPGKEKR
jgi:hypothetical protein